MRIVGILLAGLAALSQLVPARAAETNSLEIPVASYDGWRAARFGVFIHWNPSSVLQLGEGSWSRKNPTEQGFDYHRKGLNRMSKEPPPAILDGSYRKYLRRGGVPMEIYDNLFHVFNPTNFDADAWASAFEDAGAGYVVFTTKHHDGFCMFDSAFTDYDIMATPFHRDIAKELSDACRRHGLKLLWYYSRCDWFDPRHDVEHPGPYAEYLGNQIRELLTNYGEIAGIWWDSGQIEVPTRPLFDMMLAIQPHLISNGRIQGPRQQVPGVSFGTPEQETGAFNMKSPWESCVTMQGENWFWNGGTDIRSTGSCLRLLVNCAIGDGNLLLDFGPDETGRIHPDVRRNFASMGAWLRKNGESIRGTRGGPYMPGPWGGSTRRDRTVYLHITQTWPGRELELPPLPRRILGSRLLTGGGTGVTQTESGVSIAIDPAHHDPVDTILALELDGSAMDLAPIPDTSGRAESLTLDASASASTTARSWAGMPAAAVVEHTWERNKPVTPPPGLEPLADKRRGHIWRFWMAKPDDPQPWIELDLGKPTTFDRVRILEKYNRIRAFKVQIAADDGWRTIHEGAGLDVLSLALPSPVTTRKVRLLIAAFAPDGEGDLRGPGIQEFDLFLSNAPEIRIAPAASRRAP